MDIEGGEYDVLYNTKNEIFSKIKNIILEWHIISGVDGPDALKIFLENKGYKVFIKNELVIANR